MNETQVIQKWTVQGPMEDTGVKLNNHGGKISRHWQKEDDRMARM